MRKNKVSIRKQMRTPTSIIDLGSDFVYNDALLLENMQQLFTITGNVPSTCANRLHADTHCSLLFTS